MGRVAFDYCRRFFGFKGVIPIFCSKDKSKGVAIVLTIIILIYLALCGAYFIMHQNEAIRGSFETFDNDDVKYLRSAWVLLETGRFTYKDPTVDTVFIMPALTVALAAFVLMFGAYPIIQFKIFQALLGAACLYLIFLSGKKLFSARIGLVGAALMAVYAPSIYVTGTLLTEGFFYFLFLLTFYFTICAIESSKMRYYIAGGFFLGLSALFRPTVVPVVPIAVLFVWIAKKYKFADMVKFGFAVSCTVIFVLSPWILRNAIIFGEFIPFTKASGNPAFQGTFINYDRSVEETEKIDYYQIIKEKSNIKVEKYGFDELTDNAVESEMTRIRFNEVIKKEPLKFLKWYTVGKTIKNFDEPFLWVRLFNISAEKLTLQHYLMLAAGLAGFLALVIFEKNKGVMLLPALLIFLFNGIYLPFYCFSRYMFPIIFCFALYGGYFIDKLACAIANWYKIKIKAGV
ncbi:MAG: glycosyltransferase family 39 protein [Firmicutes bacterium]|nr:glycosyltransferase family 39 protein [Bacillota bacterium]